MRYLPSGVCDIIDKEANLDIFIVLEFQAKIDVSNTVSFLLRFLKYSTRGFQLRIVCQTTETRNNNMNAECTAS